MFISSLMNTLLYLSLAHLIVKLSSLNLGSSLAVKGSNPAELSTVHLQALYRLPIENINFLSHFIITVLCC